MFKNYYMQQIIMFLQDLIITSSFDFLFGYNTFHLRKKT